MEKIIVIGDDATILGFKLVGVEGIECDFIAAEKLLVEILQTNERSAGLVILQENFIESFSQKTKNLMENSSKIVIVTIPSRKGVSSLESSDFAKMVKKAIGVELK